MESENNSQEKTHWQNNKYPKIPIELELIDQIPHKEKDLTYITSYLYGGKLIVAEEVHQLHHTMDGDIFVIYVGQN